MSRFIISAAVPERITRVLDEFERGRTLIGEPVVAFRLDLDDFLPEA